MVSQSERRQVSVRIPLRLKAELEHEAAKSGYSRSEYIRTILEDRAEAERLYNRLESREDRIEQLEEQLARRSQIEQKVDVLQRRLEDREKPNAPWPVRWYQWIKRSRS